MKSGGLKAVNKHDISLQGNNGSAVLLLHGLTGSPYELKFLAEKLSKAGFTVVAPCLPGHGETLESLKQTSWQDWYEEAKKSFLELRKDFEHVGVGGLCMGTLLALELGFEFPEVAGLSLMSTTFFYDGWTIPWYSFLIPLAYYTPVQYFYSFTERPPYGIKNERLRRIVINSTKNDSIAYDRVPGVCMKQNFRLTKHVSKHLPAIHAPLLLIHALEDDTASVKNVEYVQQRIGSNNIRKVLLEDSYHMITIDNQRALVAEENLNFFKKHCQSG